MLRRSKNPTASSFFRLETLALTITISILILSVSSCSDDNPIKTTPVSEFDSARFNWRTVEIPNHGFSGIWAQDTNQIFLINQHDRSLYIETREGVVIRNTGNYFLNSIAGLSNNEIYLFGTELGGNMTIIKWNGASFEYYPTSVYVSDNNINFLMGKAVGTNQIWIASSNGVCKFDGINMNNYFYDTSLVFEDIFVSKENKIQYIAANWDASFIRQNLFEFSDTGFVKIFENIISLSDPYYTFLMQINGNKFGYQEHYIEPLSICIKNFNGSSFSNYFCFNDKIRAAWSTGTQTKSLVGLELQEFIFLSNTDHSIFEDGVGLINWDGTKPSREMMLYPYQSPFLFDGFVLFAIRKDSYLVLEPDWENQNKAFLFIGTRK